MKYFTHMTASFGDERHQALMDKCGLKGYGAYWVIVEAIAAQITRQSAAVSMQLSWRRWGLRMGIDQRSASHIIRSLNDVGLISLRCDGDLATVTMPNILKYMDEYTKRLGIETPDKLRSKEPEQPEQPDIPSSPDGGPSEKQVKGKKRKAVNPDAEMIYDYYSKNVINLPGKRTDAIRNITARLKEGFTKEHLGVAIDNYLSSTEYKSDAPYHPNNFYGQKAYFKGHLPKEGELF